MDLMLLVHFVGAIQGIGSHGRCRRPHPGTADEWEDVIFKRSFFRRRGTPDLGVHGSTARPMRLNLYLDVGRDPLGVVGAAEKRLSGCRLRVTVCRLAASIGSAAARTQPA